MKFSIDNLNAALQQMAWSGFCLWMNTDALKQQTKSMALDLKMMGVA